MRRMRLKGLIDEGRATRAVDSLLTLPVTVSRSRPLIGEAWTYRQNLIVQDAVNDVLAPHQDAPLLTGDRRIAGAPNLPIEVLHISVAG